MESVELKVVEMMTSAFAVMFNGMGETERETMLSDIRHIDTSGEPIARILMGVLLSSTILLESFTNEEDISLTEMVEHFSVLAKAFEKHIEDKKGDS